MMQIYLQAGVHARLHARLKEQWTCSCEACTITKNTKIIVRHQDGTLTPSTMANTICEAIKEQEGFTLVVA